MNDKEFYDAMISFTDPNRITVTAAGSLARQTAKCCSNMQTIRAASKRRILETKDASPKMPPITSTQQLEKVMARAKQNKRSKEYLYLALALFFIPFLAIFTATEMLGLGDTLRSFMDWYSDKAWYVSLPCHAVLWTAGAGIIAGATVAVSTAAEKIKERLTNDQQ